MFLTILKIFHILSQKIRCLTMPLYYHLYLYRNNHNLEILHFHKRMETP